METDRGDDVAVGWAIMGFWARIGAIITTALWAPSLPLFLWAGLGWHPVQSVGLAVICDIMLGALIAVEAPQALVRWVQMGREVDEQRRIQAGKRERVGGSVSLPPEVDS